MILLAFASPAAASGSPTASTTEGKVRGERLAGVEAFRGIPYAAPPVGTLRFEPPAPATRRHGTFDATGLTPPRAQLASSNGPTSLNEDCLQLDVWRPKSPHHRKLPPGRVSDAGRHPLGDRQRPRHLRHPRPRR